MDQVDEIKARLDIVDFIRQYLDLKKAGINYCAICPFHGEKTPSFMVSSERQSFRCFGCSEGGDVISFFQKIEGFSFPEALKILGERVGVKVAFSAKENQEKKSDKELIYKINLLCAKYFKLSLTQEVGIAALNYLKDRGLTMPTIEKLKIGFAPSDNKLQRLLEKDFSFDDLSKSGHPERFKHRIIFPIFDNFGLITGFSGRILEEQLPANLSVHPKYLNTPETAVFHKSKAIYGINFAKEAIRKNKRVVIVEGQMDVALAHEALIEEVVASSGTALTEDHLKMLSRLTDNIIFCFDEDEAGQKAAISAVQLSLEMGLDVKLTKINSAKDIGDLALKDKSALKDVFDKALPPVDWLAQKYKDKEPLQISDKKRLVTEAANFIQRMQNEVEKAHYIAFLAKKVGVAQITIEQVINKTKYNARYKESSPPQNVLSIEEKFLAYVLNFDNKIKSIKLKDIDFEDSSLSTIYKRLQACYNDEQQRKGEIKKIREKLSRGLQERLDAVSLEIEQKFSDNEDIALEEFTEIKSHLETQAKEKIKNNFAREIAEAEAAGDISKVRRLMVSLQESLK